MTDAAASAVPVATAAAPPTSPAVNQNKRPNFSLAPVNPNGVNKVTHQNLATGKPGTAKKLTIKNFKGKFLL